MTLPGHIKGVFYYFAKSESCLSMFSYRKTKQRDQLSETHLAFKYTFDFTQEHIGKPGLLGVKCLKRRSIQPGSIKAVITFLKRCNSCRHLPFSLIFLDFENARSDSIIVLCKFASFKHTQAQGAFTRSEKNSKHIFRTYFAHISELHFYKKNIVYPFCLPTIMRFNFGCTHFQARFYSN